MKRYRITVTAKEIYGDCPVYRLGDKIQVDGYFVNAKWSDNVCLHALGGMLTLLSAFSHGVSAKQLGIGTEEDVGKLQCPDPGPPHTAGGRVIFELKREAMDK